MKNIGITIYGCDPNEANMFCSLTPYYAVTPFIISGAVSETNAQLAAGNQCISVNHKSEVSLPILLALKAAGVKYISSRSIGLNHIDISAAEKMGIIVQGVDYSPDSVADYTVMLMLMALRSAKTLVISAEKGGFRQENVCGKELRGMTVGVIGTGRIGKAVIERLNGFGCRVIAYDKRRKEQIHYVTLDYLLQNSDIVTLHLPLNDETYHIINREQIAGMKKGAFIINTGRGALINTSAMVEALENGTLGGAALDVIEGEEGIFYFDYREKPVKNPLLLNLQHLPNVIITPHSAYYTDRALNDIALKTIENCLDFERRLTP